MTEQAKCGDPGWYYRLSSFFKEIFRRPVYKIPLHSGFSCPNRDGTISRGGCSFCYNPSFSPYIKGDNLFTIEEQLRRGKKKQKEAFYLAYFQSYTNTYAPLEQLNELYGRALADPEVVGLSIATRPDCIPDEILALLETYARRCHLWLEYGLQSAHDRTLKMINRGHDAAAFTDAITRTKGRGIYTCAHVILGLPGETRKMMLETIRFLNKLEVEGIKFHHLQVIKNTPLADEYAREGVKVFENAAAYIDVLCDCLEELSPKIVVQRLAGQATSKELLVAPHWPESSGQIAALVTEELRQRKTWQGSARQCR